MGFYEINDWDVCFNIKRNIHFKTQSAKTRLSLFIATLNLFTYIKIKYENFAELAQALKQI